MVPPGGRPPTLRWLVVLVGLVAAVAALPAIGARATHGARTTADEPQYLLTALSLGEDLDLDIADELDDRRYEPFHEITLDTQTVVLRRDGQQLSPHDPLLPLLLAVPMRVGGWVGAKVALAIMSGVLAGLTLWTAVRRFGAGPGRAAWVVGSLSVAPPLVSYGSQVYPELPAGLAVVTIVALVTGPWGRGRLVAVAAAVVALPWLSVKYAPVAAVATLFVLWWTAAAAPDRRRAAVRTALTVGGLAAAGAAYLVVHRRVYGGWTVYAAGDHFVDGELLVVGSDPDYVGRTRRLVGLLVDRQFGLVAWTPAFVALPAALALAGRGRAGGRDGAGPPPGFLVLTLFAAGWATATWVAFTMHGWWWPGRQVVHVLPLGVLALTVLVERFPRMLSAIVVGAVAGAVNWSWLVVEASTGRRTLVVDFHETGAPLHRLLAPVLADHQRWSGTTLGVTLAWTVALGLSAWAVWASPPARIMPPAHRPDPATDDDTDTAVFAARTTP